MRRQTRILVLILAAGGSAALTWAQPISGTVRDASGKALNGAFVSARTENVTYTTTVYSDDAGKFRFPDLPAGSYTVRAFARGYKDSVRPAIAVTDGKASNLNFSLSEEKDPVARFNQATPGEWLASLSGPESEKYVVSKNCSGCHHNLSQLMKHRFSKEDWLKIIPVMERLNSAHAIYGVNEAPLPTGLPRQPGTWMVEKPGVWQFGTREEIATFLAKVQGPDSPVPAIRFHPRARGRVTRAVITTYKIPRANAAPHDVQIDKRGNIWYNDFKSPYIGRLDPRTAQFKEYKLPVPPPLHPGSDNMWVLPESVDDSVWLHERWAHRLIRFDIPSEKVIAVLPEISVEAIDPDGKTIRAASGSMDLTTAKVTAVKFNGSTAGYGSLLDSKGMGYRGGVGDGDIKKMNAATGEVVRYPTPTPDSGPRRGCVDANDNPWFGEWHAGKIVKLDARTGEVQEFTPSVPFGAFYEVCTDKKNGMTWGYDWHNDRLVSVNGKTGEMTEYPMPALDNESRRTVIDSSTNPPSVWIYGMMEGTIIRVQAP